MTAKKTALAYIPAPEISAEFKIRFAEVVPLCPAGEPYLRYVWGMDRMERRGKFERRRYSDLTGKYIGLNRWVLEGWQASDVYDRNEWERRSDVMGAFPNNGVWDFIAIHETDEGEYLPLDNSALERARSWAFWRSKGRKRSVEALFNQQEERQYWQTKREKEAADRVLDDFVEEVIRAEEAPGNTAFSLPSESGKYKRTAAGLYIPK